MAPSIRSARVQDGLPVASAIDVARFGAQVGLPLVAGGVIVRRAPVLALAEKVQADKRVVPLLREFRERYGPGPLRIPLPGRTLALVLTADDVHRVLVDDAAAFTPANREKRGALRQFQPHGVLISRGEERAERREFNETVLETQRPLHELADPITAVVRDEANQLLDTAANERRLSWDTFTKAWWRIVRRIVLGHGARDDDKLTDELGKLRSAANWATFVPVWRHERERFEERLRAHLRRAEPGTLASALADAPAGENVDRGGQVPHWLFAFDAAGMTTFRTLALLATHPEQAARAYQEVEDLGEPRVFQYLRSCVLESLRLWPTTPVVLRDSTVDTKWGDGGTIPEGTGFVVLAGAFHRDPELSYADEFAPDIWLDGRARANPALVPFSDGPGQCPGRNLVLFVTSTLLSMLLERNRYQLLSGPTMRPGVALPATLNHFGLDFGLVPRR